MPDPVTQTIHFDPTGGPLTVVMRAVPAAPGHYSLMLFEHDFITLVKDFGNDTFSSVSNNTHALGGSAKSHDGRILLAQTSIGVVGSNVAPVMTIVQGGTELGSVTDASAPPSGALTKDSDLVINLSAQGTGNASAAMVLGAAAASKKTDKVMAKKAKALTKLSKASVKKAAKEGAP